MLVINPEECIDCNLCVPECPVDAIYAEEDLPEDQKEFITLNEQLSQQWPILNTQKPPLPDAHLWEDKPEKRQYLDTKEES